MTGKQFERDFCELMYKKGYWSLNIPRNESGAQPFDVIAVAGDSIRTTVYAVDCKVCAANRFPLSRVEDNQWLAFDLFRRKVPKARCGLAIFHDGKIYGIDFDSLILAKHRKQASVELCNTIQTKGTDMAAGLWFDEDNIFALLGRHLT